MMDLVEAGAKWGCTLKEYLIIYPEDKVLLYDV